MSDITRIDSGPRMSQAVVHGGIAYLAGQVGIEGASVTEQTQAVLDKIDVLLEKVGSDKTKVLTAHVVAGKWSAADIAAKARASKDGFYHFEAVSGDALSAQVKGKNVYIIDESGNASRVTIADVNQSNGVIHVVNSVLVPK